MRNKSKKNIEVELYVDKYIIDNGFPPTYRLIEVEFNLSRCAAYNRCKKFREKMVSIKKLSKKSKISIVDLRISYEKRFISSTMTKEQLEGCESVWQWIKELYYNIT